MYWNRKLLQFRAARRNRALQTDGQNDHQTTPGCKVTKGCLVHWRETCQRAKIDGHFSQRFMPVASTRLPSKTPGSGNSLDLKKHTSSNKKIGHSSRLKPTHCLGRGFGQADFSLRACGQSLVTCSVNHKPLLLCHRNRANKI